MDKIIQQPKVAIVGRPNVGKSTFFNRLIGARKAIESETPGTTRDRIYGIASWCGKDFDLIDTAGIMGETNDVKALAGLIKQSVLAAIEQADIIIFVVDVTEVTPADREISKLLHKSGKNIFLVANKADNSEREIVSKQVFSLGFGQPYYVSAISGRGVADFLDELTKNFSQENVKTEEDYSINVSLIGRPNVGKSTLLNSIIGSEKSIVSDIPGTTRDSNDELLFYKGRKIRFIDTAGIRRSGKIEKGVEKFSIIRTMSALRESEVVIILIDADEGLTNQDCHIIGEAKELGKSIIVAVNKFDIYDSFTEEEKKTRMSYILGHMQNDLAFVPFVPVIFISAKEKNNLTILLKKITEVYDQRFINTDKLVIEEIIKSAAANNPQLPKISDFYQEKTNPVVFKLKTKNPKNFHFSHIRYLENRLRDNYPFVGTPIFIDLIK